MTSELSKKIDWAVEKANKLYAEEDYEGTARVVMWAKKQYPKNRFPAWARQKLDFNYRDLEIKTKKSLF